MFLCFIQFWQCPIVGTGKPLLKKLPRKLQGAVPKSQNWDLKAYTTPDRLWAAHNIKEQDERYIKTKKMENQAVLTTKHMQMSPTKDTIHSTQGLGEQQNCLTLALPELHKGGSHLSLSEKPQSR